MSTSVNWRNFFAQHGIDFVESGPNVSSHPDEIGMNCFLCNREGRPDPSTHLTFNTRTGNWRCWRNEKHRGRDPYKLVARYYRTTYQQAQAIVSSYRVDTGESLLDQLKNQFEKQQEEGEQESTMQSIELPEFHTPAHYKFKRLQPTKDYLENRGFHPVIDFVKQYDVRVPAKGDLRDYFVLPLTMNNEYVGLTSRALNEQARVRYKSLSKRRSTDGMTAVRTTDKHLFHYDWVWNDPMVKYLFVVEGPFDAAKLDWYGKPYGLRAVAIYTTQISTTQKNLLFNLVEHLPRIEEVYVMLDSGEMRNQANLVERLSTIPAMNSPVKPDSFGVKDPGDLCQDDVLSIVEQLSGVAVKESESV